MAIYMRIYPNHPYPADNLRVRRHPREFLYQLFRGHIMKLTPSKFSTHSVSPLRHSCLV